MSPAVRVVLPAGGPGGLLSLPAWEALRSGPVLAGAAGGLPELRAAGIQVEDCALEEAALARAADRLGPLVWLAADEAEVAAVVRLAGQAGLAASTERAGDHVAGGRLLDVVALMDRLRSPGGCPWDAAQTHASLARYLLEETYEAYQALEDGDLAALREELGDVLLQVAFHSRVAQEGPQPWSVDDVAADLVAKLVRRHPHVFAGAPVDDLEASWEAGKAVEKGRTSVTDGVPLGQPALMLAAKLQSRAARTAAPLPAYDGMGGQLWDLVTRCREQGVDPEQALRAVARRFRDELAGCEEQVRADGQDPAQLTAEQWRERWPDRGRDPGPEQGRPGRPDPVGSAKQSA